ncbi:glycosyltransferase [Polaribacter atrinae]|uniref:glycosyltransferase n=1 Tax=Polaribacter atrinae TaxID=1333662 RepID=UPI0030F9328C
MIKKKILIISPVGAVGGRELEVGFIASTLSDLYDVKVISTGNYTRDSQVITFKGFSFTGVNALIFKQNFYIRIFIKLVSLFKQNQINSYSALSNAFVKKILNIKLKRINILKEEILKTDLVLFCAQLTSNYLVDVIPYAKNNNKPVLFRTTGFIDENKDFSYLKYIDLFIHHSKKNAERLDNNYPFKIIDQCSFNEDEFLKIPVLDRKVHNFMTVSRIDKNKNINVVINSFCKTKDPKDMLYVVGSGPDLERLKAVTKDERVVFTGFIPNDELQKIHKICECVIISFYKKESGPITAIEAMASGKVIISSKTGAMTERLKDEFSFWHDNDEVNLFNIINEVKKLEVEKVKRISKQTKDRYNSKYSKVNIANKYKECISFYI